MKYQTILLAAGNSSRSSLPYNKVLHLIENKPIIYLSASNFINDERCNKIFLVCKEEEINTFKEVFTGIDKIEYVIGGKTRQESVNNALKYIHIIYKERFSFVNYVYPPNKHTLKSCGHLLFSVFLHNDSSVISLIYLLS